MTKTPGLDQSQALTRAAQKLSAARARLAEAEDLQDPLDRYVDAVENAELAYKAAFKAYTNPFGVEKTHG